MAVLFRPSMRAAAVLSALFALSTPALAQNAGSLTGIVVDATTQSPLAKVTVTARSPALLGEQSAVTDAEGAFEMTLLPAGTYDLMVKHDGYQTFAPGGLALKDHRVRIRLALMPVQKAPTLLQTAVEFNESMTAPTMVSGPNPEYSSDAVERGIEGTMQIRCIVATTGAVRECKVLKGLPYMDRPVIDALEARRYKPAMAHGKPVDVYYTFTIKLRLPAGG